MVAIFSQQQQNYLILSLFHFLFDFWTRYWIKISSEWRLTQSKKLGHLSDSCFDALRRDKYYCQAARPQQHSYQQQFYKDIAITSPPIKCPQIFWSWGQFIRICSPRIQEILISHSPFYVFVSCVPPYMTFQILWKPPSHVSQKLTVSHAASDRMKWPEPVF